MKTLTIEIPDEMRERAEALAALRGKTLDKLAEELLAEGLARAAEDTADISDALTALDEAEREGFTPLEQVKAELKL